MKGRLVAKNGKYYVVISYQDENGKSKQKWVATGLDKRTTSAPQWICCGLSKQNLQTERSV